MSKSNATNNAILTVVDTPVEVPSTSAPITEVNAAPPAEAPKSTSKDLQVEWSSVFRDARDTGANSVLSRHVLKKSVELLSDGNGHIDKMNSATENVQDSIENLKIELNGISGISKLSKMIAINLAIESARLGDEGATFIVIANEMEGLDAAINEYIAEIDKKISVITESIEVSQKLVKNVNQLFYNTNVELTQFRNLMLRIEDLSLSQTQKLEKLEKKLSG